MVGITFLACAVMAGTFLLDDERGSWMLVGINFGVFVPMLSSFPLMLHYRKRVISLKKERDGLLRVQKQAR